MKAAHVFFQNYLFFEKKIIPLFGLVVCDSDGRNSVHFTPFIFIKSYMQL